mmetsp:Transcript_6760/g.7555  ORF Transcript_6760/g.7555 Transcript_6760/m.7555 type:complete len:262 (+) Transcript_6760:1992-2777(+)
MQGRSKCSCRNDRPGEGFEQVSTHTRNITHIVSDVVGNCCGIVRGILVEFILDLAHQVSANVSRLGVDATTNPSEQGNRRTPKSETTQGFPHFKVILCLGLKDQVQDGNPAQTAGDDTKSHHGTAFECNLEPSVKPIITLASQSRANVGFRGNFHPNVTRQCGEASTHDEADGSWNRDPGGHGDEDNDDKDSKCLVLSLEECVRSFSDQLRDPQRLDFGLVQLATRDLVHVHSCHQGSQNTSDQGHNHIRLLVQLNPACPE